MAGKIVLADTSVLIDYFRKTDKSKSSLILLYRKEYDFCISAITEYEVYTGAAPDQIHFWQNLLLQTEVISFDKKVVADAVRINKELKRKRKLISIADLFIAATAVCFQWPLATLNRKHFERIDGLELMETHQ